MIKDFSDPGIKNRYNASENENSRSLLNDSNGLVDNFENIISKNLMKPPYGIKLPDAYQDRKHVFNNSDGVSSYRNESGISDMFTSTFSMTGDADTSSRSSSRDTTISGGARLNNYPLVYPFGSIEEEPQQDFFP